MVINFAARYHTSLKTLYRNIHKVAWLSPDGIITNQIDHLQNVLMNNCKENIAKTPIKEIGINKIICTEGNIEKN